MTCSRTVIATDLPSQQNTTAARSLSRPSAALSAEHDCRTVAFPAISTGVYHFPLDRAAAIAVREIRAFLQTHAVPDRVLLVCFDARTAQAYENALR